MDPDFNAVRFGGSQLLQGLSDASTKRVAERAHAIQLQAGEWLFHEGELAYSAFLVQSGRIEIVRPGNTHEVIRTVKRGAVIGELALLARNVRSASARAVRDCELLEISRADFEQILLEDQQFVLSLCGRLGTQLAAHRSAADVQDPPRCVAIVGLDPHFAVDEVAARLADALAGSGDAAVLRAEATRPADYLTLIDRAQASHDWVILEATAGPADRWTQLCLAEADRVVALTRGHPGGEWVRRPDTLENSELLILGHPGGKSPVSKIRARAISTLTGGSDIQRYLVSLARRLSGRAVGIVFSGGGARAFAHLGVVAELRAAGVQIDRVAGASMGALVAAAVAQQLDDAAMYEVFHRNFVARNPSGDYTLPAYSLIRGRRTARLLHETFGATRIEQLPLRFFCVSADLNSRSLVVHRGGLLREALLASLAIPGVFPPIPTPDGRLLVDGGVLDNLPVETMARDAEGPVIAVDVTRAGPWRAQRKGARSAWRARALSLISGQRGEVPRLGETMLRTLVVGSRDTAASAHRYADLVITPKVGQVGLLDWKRLPGIREAGRAAVRSLLEDDPGALRLLHEPAQRSDHR
jgi:predicted acylesterase/phospholipase RssA/CRP-like cAMP-binding protein